MTTEQCPTPVKIILHKKSRTLEVEFDNGETFIMTCGYLRAFSSSAEMRELKDRRALGDEFKQVNILSIEPVGQYAIKPIFSDGHRTGIYSWQNLYELGRNFAKNTNHY